MSSCRLSLLAALALPLFVSAQEVVSVKGALLAQKAGPGWEAVKAGTKAPLDRRLVSLFDSEILSANGAVMIHLHGGIGEVGPLPAFESAVQVHDNSKVDLDVSLERGIIVLQNKKKEGPAKIDLRVRGKTIQVTLREPAAKLGIDLYSRHAPGLNALTNDNPVLFLFALASQGNVEIAHHDTTLSLKAPPGPALVRWDSVLQKPDVQHLDKLPDWITPTPEEKKIIDQINLDAQPLATGNAPLAFVKLLFSSDPIQRKVGLTALGALGTPAPLFITLQKSKHADTRQFAILVIRNWLGQEPGQIKKLQEALGGVGLSKTDIESLVHLLVGFDEEERSHPATYQLLIEGLKHSKLLVRELAYWHLSRMAPAGASIAYDPAGSPEQLQAAVARWRELIPAGELPPAPKK